MTKKSTGQMSLTKFKDCLRVPPILRPYKTDDQRYNLRIHMRPAQVQLHSELPPSEVWTYEGLLPGPTIEVSRGQHVQIEWVNAIPPAQPYPITAVTAPDGSLTGRLLHKIEDGTMEFFGPFTLLNGTIWPPLPVDARQYRLRLLNGSN